MVDYDGSISINEGIARLNGLGLKYLLITSKSHTPEVEKFHILLFYDRLITNPEQHRKIIRYFYEKHFWDGDPSVKDLGRFFMGSPKDATVKINNDGSNINTRGILDIMEFQLEPDLEISLANGKTVLLDDIKEKTSCQCPHPNHDDTNPSAFIDMNDKGLRYCHCSSCDWTWWEKEEKHNWDKKNKDF